RERAAFSRAQKIRTALNEGVTTQGGFLVPPSLDPTVILTNAGTINSWRQLADVKQTATQTRKGVSSAGVTAEWTAEAAEAAGAADFVLADVYATHDALPARALTSPKLAWVAHPVVASKIRRFGEGVTANAAFWQDLVGDVPSRLLGASFYQSSDMDGTIVSG